MVRPEALQVKEPLAALEPAMVQCRCPSEEPDPGVAAMRYRLLGPLEAVGDDGRTVAFPGERERVLLATLALSANHVVSTSRLVEALWGEDPPPTAANTLQVHVSKLRRKLAEAASGREVIASAPRGYLLRAEAGEVDMEDFEKLVSKREGSPREVSERLREALALWRGPALADVGSVLLEGDKGRLEELRLVALEDRTDADLALGRHGRLVAELEALVRAQPLRETVRAKLMLALYRCGRQADALATYQEGRHLLAEELGIDPRPELQALELAILNQSPELDVPGQRLPVVVPSDNLPVQLTRFIGRERELAELRPLVSGSRLVSLTGPGGSGKTRLAVQLAAEAVGGWENGIWFIDLSALVDPDLVSRSVAIALGVREEAGRPIADTVVDALSERHLLMLLDNCEHLVDGCAKFADLLVRSCPRVHVLGTSREPLGLPGERVYRVPPLSLPPIGTKLPDRDTALRSEAVELFVDRARSHNPRFVFDDSSVGPVMSICAHLDGIPLGDRAGRRPAAPHVHHRYRGSPGVPLPPAHRRQPHCPPAPPDPPSTDRLVLRHAQLPRPRRARPPVGLRRRLRPRSGRERLHFGGSGELRGP